MIEEVKETFESVRETVGDKWFFVLIAGVVVLFLFFLFKDDNESEEVFYSPSGVAGYPEVGENSEVVIDSVNQTMDAFSSEILDILGQTQGSIDNVQDSLDVFKDEVSDKFESVDDRISATNDYINEGLSKWEDISEKIDTLETQSNVTVTKETDPSIRYVEVSPNGNTVKGWNDLTDKEKANVTNSMNATKTTTTTTTKADSPKVTYYQYQTKAGLNTSTSIVDGLKAIGVDSSMKNRKKIAEMNGISNYTGTYSQNVTMLNKLKSGTLVKSKG